MKTDAMCGYLCAVQQRRRCMTTVQLFFILVCLQLHTFIQPVQSQAKSEDIKYKMETHGVVKDVVPQVPSDIVEVTYENNLGVELGNELTPTQVQKPPVSINWPADENSFYTLIMTDPDAPSRENPHNGEWQHWLVVNIPGKHVDQGQVLSEYVGSGPPKGTGLHRYVFLVYRQKSKKDFNMLFKSKNTAKGRNNWKANDWATEKELELVAANFYQAKWDEYVPELYKQFTDA